jgi:hypothetical protein
MLAGNVPQLGEVAEIEAQMFSFAQKFIEELPLNLVLNPPFCQTVVVRSCFLPVWICKFSFSFFFGIF